MFFLSHLEKILEMANSDEWPWIIPRVAMRTKVAISILNQDCPKFWELSASQLEEILQKYNRIEAQFWSYDHITLGFAIRTLRLQPAQPAKV
jgi:hypothetical protein